MSRDDLSRSIADRLPAPGERHPGVIDAARLFGADREVVIVHKGERYRLRVTQNDKLILTK